ncbi:hypothetical protein [Halorhabdus salina]|uniref:hypothetical protein n=1 Tax=Halorhabdus salina TaxID=2750670 RepID=UPI0015EEEB57|nr:hypothetical protein [Halorhabdus salina]
MDASERRAYEEVIEATGDDAVEVLAKSHGPARELVADGEKEIGFRKGVARAADSDAIDSFDEIDDAVRKIDELDIEAKSSATETYQNWQQEGCKSRRRTGKPTQSIVVLSKGARDGSLPDVLNSFGPVFHLLILRSRPFY